MLFEPGMSCQLCSFCVFLCICISGEQNDDDDDDDDIRSQCMVSSNCLKNVGGNSLRLKIRSLEHAFFSP